MRLFFSAKYPLFLNDLNINIFSVGRNVKNKIVKGRHLFRVINMAALIISVIGFVYFLIFSVSIFFLIQILIIIVQQTECKMNKSE